MYARVCVCARQWACGRRSPTNILQFSIKYPSAFVATLNQTTEESLVCFSAQFSRLWTFLKIYFWTIIWNALLLQIWKLMRCGIKQRKPFTHPKKNKKTRTRTFFFSDFREIIWFQKVLLWTRYNSPSIHHVLLPLTRLHPIFVSGAIWGETIINMYVPLSLWQIALSDVC